MKIKNLIYGLGCLLLLASCDEKQPKSNQAPAFQSAEMAAKGKLFIIGGGKRPPELIQELIALSSLKKNDTYGVILPMSSSEPDSAVWYAKKQFTDLGIAEKQLKGMNFTRENFPKQWVDSLKNADLVYITGGDQNRFMDIVLDTPIHQAIMDAYTGGATIAGTSAGAAVMSKKMITGDEFKHPEYTGDFRTIEAENIEIDEGLGLAPELIVDQHFIWRMRMNRLLSVAIENPEEIAVGIDESTALVVENGTYRITGKSQAIVVENLSDSLQTKNGLLGTDHLKVQVVLPGKTFQITPTP